MMLKRFRKLGAMVVVVGGGVLVAGAAIPSVRAQVRRDGVGPVQNAGRVKVTKIERPARRPEPPDAPSPAPLSQAEKVRQFKAVLASLADEQRRAPDLQLGRAFPLAVLSQTKVTLKPMPERLTPRHPYLGTTAHLNLMWPRWVLGSENSVKFKLPIDIVGDAPHIQLFFDVVQGKTYLLDFTVGDADHVEVQLPLEKDNKSVYHLELPVTGGHVLVPFLAPFSGKAEVDFNPKTVHLRFYSLEISTVE